MFFLRHPSKVCPKSFFGHSFEETTLNAGFYHFGALAREGKVCRHCGMVVFPETDQEYFDRLPDWLKAAIAEQNPKTQQSHMETDGDYTQAAIWLINCPRQENSIKGSQ
jgi:hypothetical protein